MKIYIASSFSQISEVEKLAVILESKGHTITEKWWNRPYQTEDMGKIHTSDLKEIYDNLSWNEFYNKPETIESFKVDLEGVEKADALIYRAPDGDPKKYNGASIEAGIAIGLNKPIILLGNLETSVMFSYFLKAQDTEDLLKILEMTESYLEANRFIEKQTNDPKVPWIILAELFHLRNKNLKQNKEHPQTENKDRYIHSARRDSIKKQVKSVDVGSKTSKGDQ